MKATEPLPLHHSWPLFESGLRFDLGVVGDDAGRAGLLDAPWLASRGIGRWDCDLADGGLDWSPEVFDIFGLPRDARVSREDTLLLYCEASRAAMERLRGYAIRHGRGFTLDAEIRPAAGRRHRWMRLTAMPLVESGRAVRLFGYKQDVTREYC